MYFAIDLILVALMAAVIFNAVRRGFIVSVFRLLSTVVSVAAAAIFYKDLGLVFYDHFVYDKISGYLSGLIARAAENSDGTFDLHGIFSELPENIRNITDVFGVNIDALFAEFWAPSMRRRGMFWIFPAEWLKTLPERFPIFWRLRPSFLRR